MALPTLLKPRLVWPWLLVIAVGVVLVVVLIVIAHH